MSLKGKTILITGGLVVNTEAAKVQAIARLKWGIYIERSSAKK